MVCDHLAPLEQALIESGAQETARGAVWSKNCREWVYFNVVLEIPSLQRRFSFPSCVEVHENKDQKSGLERGFVCNACNDAVMGLVHGGTICR